MWVAGDAAFTCGVTFEALNNVAEQTKRFIVVLNDNEWSIDKNVGAIASYFNKIATHPTYAHLHDKAAIRRNGRRPVAQLAHKVEAGVKNLLLPSVIFEEFGLRYYGPIDGHDIPTLINTFEFLKTQNEPVLLHILRRKGKGYEPALEQPDKFHGLGKFESKLERPRRRRRRRIRRSLARHWRSLRTTTRRLSPSRARCQPARGFHFAKAHPDQYFDVGIAEEHATLFACGLATQGFKPFLAIYSTFMQRAYDMDSRHRAAKPERLPVHGSWRPQRR